MADQVLRQAVANITNFGRKASLPTENTQSTQYTDTFGDILEADLVPAPVQEPVSSSAHSTTNPTDATSTTKSTRTDDPTTVPAIFSLSRELDTSPARGFCFGKAVMPAINTKLAKGPAVQKKAEQQLTDLNPTSTLIPSISSTVESILTASQSEKAGRHSSTNHATPEPHETSSLQGPDSQSCKSQIEVVPEAAQRLACESKEEALPDPPDTSLYYVDAEDSTTTRVSTAHKPDSIRSAGKALSQDHSTSPGNPHHEENIAMIDGPTFVNEGSAYHTINKASSRASSLSPSLGRSLRSYSRALSNRSLDHEKFDRSVLHRLQADGKVQKRRAGPRHKSPAPPEGLGISTSETAPIDPEDLLKVLTICYRNQKQQRAELRAKEKKKDEAIAEFKMIITFLDNQLQESNEQVSRQEAKLQKYRQLVPGWQDKVTKLSNFVKGLNNDHARLRDDARSIQDEQENSKRHKEAIDKILGESVGALEKERLYHQERLLKAHHRTEMAEQALNARDLDLRSESTRLRAEQDRSTSLQDSLNKLASDRGDIMVKLANQEATISSKIAGLDETMANAVRNAWTSGYEVLNPKLEECILLLKEPRAMESAHAEDVQKLHFSVKENGDKITQIASICQENFSATSSLEDRLLSEIKPQLQRLMSSIESGRPLEQQMLDLHKVKATITERLQATELYLADSRHKLTAAEHQEKAQLQKVAALEAELTTLRNQPQESPLMALRMHDSEKQCKKLTQQLSASEVQLKDAKSDLATKCSEKADLEDSLQAARTEITELQTSIDTISLDKVAVEGQAKLNEDRLKEHFSALLKDQTSMISNKFVNELHRLRNVEKELNASKATISLLEAIKEEALAKLDTAKQDLESRQTTHGEVSQMLQKCQRERAQLEQDIEGIRHQDAEKSKQFQKMEAEIRQLREEASKSQQIKNDLQAHVEAEKASASESMKAAETSANNNHQLLAQSRNETLRLEQEVSDLRKSLQKNIDMQPEIQEGLNTVRADYNDAKENLSKESQKVQQLLNQLEEAEADNRRLREQNKALLNSASPKPSTATGMAKPMPNAGPQSSFGLKHPPELEVNSAAAAAPKQHVKLTKAVVVEDSQDIGGIIEESQYPGLQRPPSSDELQSTNPVTYMPKVIQDLVAAPSSPLTDPPSTPPLETEGAVILPPSRRGRVVEDSQAAGMSSQELGNDYGTPSQYSVRTLTKSTTKTKSKSVERSLIKTSQPVFGRMPQAETGGIASTSGYTNVQAEAQAMKTKRLATSQTQPGRSMVSKRQKFSSQVSKEEGPPTLGGAKTSSAKPVKRKPSKQSDKYQDKFTAELEK